MYEFLVAYASFLIAHAVPVAPGLRKRLVNCLGRRRYLLAYSLVSLVLLSWLIAAAKQAESPLLWMPYPGLAAIPVIVMPLSCAFLVAGLLGTTPLSISLKTADQTQQLPAVAAITRHPILWALILWGLSHIPANGDAVSILLFGGMSAYALLGCKRLDIKRRSSLGEERWAEAARETSVVPFLALATGRGRLRWGWDIALGLSLGLALYLFFLLEAHVWLLGVDPLAIFSGWSPLA